MKDQAYHLRNLKLQSAVSDRQNSNGSQIVISLLGSKGGVGTTSLTTALARQLAADGHTVTMTCWGARFADLCALCDIEDGSPDSTTVTHQAECDKRMSVTFAILNGHDGSMERARLLVTRLADAAASDVILVDLAAGLDDARTAFCAVSDATIVVTTADTLAIMDTYAIVKRLATRGAFASANVHPLVNQVADRQAACQASDRLQATCQRFLSISLRSPVYLPLCNDTRRSESAHGGALHHVPMALDSRVLARRVMSSATIKHETAPLCASG